MTENKINEKAALVILDGWGINHNANVSAIEAADTPYYDYLMNTFPNSVLTTFGEEVGLPEGQMGNSEVGHMNIGAGRVVYQELVRINKAFQTGEVAQIPEWINAIKYAGENKRRIHILGLLSDGGVHSHVTHLLDMCDLLKKEKTEVFIHAFLDGRDTDPQGGALYLKMLQDKINHSNISLATVIGRYYAMDRDNRWERTKKAYDLLVTGQGESVEDFVEAVRANYKDGVTDEFMKPLKSVEFESKNQKLNGDDVLIFFNFRTDRPRQLTHVLTQKDKAEHGMMKLPLYTLTFSEYDKTFSNVHVLFKKDNLDFTLGQTISSCGKTQVRIAETEKYPHVTFFFNGGRETPFENEDRIMVPSPKVATYDLMPEMSAYEITEKIIQHIKNKIPDFICLNYANTDMVGHTGDFKAAVKATETVDSCLRQLVPLLQEFKYNIVIIADHGNSDVMVNEDGSPNTAHTTNPVPFILVTGKSHYKASNGKLGDIAPTILKLMKLPIPPVMNGEILFS